MGFFEHTIVLFFWLLFYFSLMKIWMSSFDNDQNGIQSSLYNKMKRQWKIINFRLKIIISKKKSSLFLIVNFVAWKCSPMESKPIASDDSFKIFVLGKNIKTSHVRYDVLGKSIFWISGNFRKLLNQLLFKRSANTIS